MGNTYADLLAVEQQAVDRAYDAWEAGRAHASEQAARPAAANPKDAAALKRALEGAAGGGDLQGQPLVVLRVDTDDFGPAYIGRRAVHDDQGNLVLISWTAPIAVTWRNAAVDDPGEVVLRRLLHCDGRQVLGWSDQIDVYGAGRVADDEPAAHGADGTDGADGAHGAGRAEGADGAPGTWDDPLLAELDRVRDGSMRDIVATIQREQLALVSDPRAGLLVVQGGPGTGKSAVGLHRVTWLLDNRPELRPEDVLVIGPSRRFLEHVASVLPVLGSGDVAAIEFAQLFPSRPRAYDTPAARRVKSDARMADALRRFVDGRIRVTWENRRIPAENGVLAVPFEGTRLTVPVVLVEELARDVRGTDGPFETRRARFRERLLDLLEERLAEDGGFVASMRGDRSVRERLLQTPLVRTALADMWPHLPPERLLRTLLGSRRWLEVACGDGLFTDREIAALHRPGGAPAAAEDAWTAEDLVLLDELRHLVHGAGTGTYRHIVVDEAQDLTPMQARMLARRCPSGSMTILGDLAQATGPHPYEEWGTLARLLTGGQDWELAELRLGYRVPRAVMDFAAPLQLAAVPGLEPTASLRETPDSLRQIETTAWEAAVRAAREADALVSERSVAVVTPDDESAEAVRHLARPEVVALAAHDVKGLEFDHVVVLEPALIAERPGGLRLLYTALTRCTQSLVTVASRPVAGVETLDGLDGGAAGPDEAGALRAELAELAEELGVEDVHLLLGLARRLVRPDAVRPAE